jgi:hypothetical protein
MFATPITAEITGLGVGVHQASTAALACFTARGGSDSYGANRPYLETTPFPKKYHGLGLFLSLFSSERLFTKAFLVVFYLFGSACVFWFHLFPCGGRGVKEGLVVTVLGRMVLIDVAPQGVHGMRVRVHAGLLGSHTGLRLLESFSVGHGSRCLVLVLVSWKGFQFSKEPFQKIET